MIEFVGMPVLNDRVKQAIEECETAISNIRAGKSKPARLADTFSKLSRIDYRDDSEIAISMYIKAFMGGAVITEKVPDIERTARNSPKTRDVMSIEMWCSRLKREHYVHVQKPFFSHYTSQYKNIVYSTDRAKAIKPAVIVDMLKKMNNKGEIK